MTVERSAWPGKAEKAVLNAARLLEQLPKDAGAAREIVGCLEELVETLSESPRWRGRELAAMALCLLLPRELKAARQVVAELYRLLPMLVPMAVMAMMMGAGYFCGECLEDLLGLC